MNNKAETPSSIGDMPMPSGFPYRSVFLHGRPQHEKYDDFWRRHPPMDVTHRAKIFAAFDALAGFDDRIAGKEVDYLERRALSESEKEALDRKFSILRDLTRNGKAARKNRPQITVRYFSPCADEDSAAYGSGGLIKTVTGICQKADAVSRTITVSDMVLAIDDIADITGELFEGMDEGIP